MQSAGSMAPATPIGGDRLQMRNAHFANAIATGSHQFLALLLLVALGLVILSMFGSRVAGWEDWAWIVAIAASIASIGIVFAILQYVKGHKKADELEQAKFMMSLADDFSSHDRLYKEAWLTLQKYTETPREMDEAEYANVCAALEGCYKSVRFLFRIAELTKRGILDRDMLCLFYYDDIVGQCTCNLDSLIPWCGTGLDLSANYESYELGRMARSIRELVTTLNVVQEKQGNQTYEHVMRHFDRIERDFLADLDRYDVASDNYVENYVEVK